MKNPLSEKIYIKRTREMDSEMRGNYFRDQTAIIHSMPFRRLKHKTQVFFAPQNDHVCTRIEHVMHVATIASTLCKGLNRNGWELDVEAAFAIGLGHDLGHAPFGHEGEFILTERLGKKNAFIHEINSYRVVEYLANNGKGLNLTYMVKDGIISHNGEKFEQYLVPDSNKKDLDTVINRRITPSSFEGCIVRFSDKIAYLGRDIEDAITAGFIKRSDIPLQIRKYLGERNSDIIDTLVKDFVDNSKNQSKVGFSDDTYEHFRMLQKFNYSSIYLNERLKSYKKQARIIINTLFDYFAEIYEKNGREYEKYSQMGLKIEKSFGKYIENMHEFYLDEKDANVIIVDYIAGMTDLYMLDAIKQLTIPGPVF